MARPFIALFAAAALAAPAARAAADLQIYFQSTLASAGYQRAVFDKLARAFKLPRKKGLPASGKKAVVQTVISRGGALSSAEVTLSSGSAKWDAAALDAVRRAAPFPPLPAELAAGSVEVHFHFAWTE